MSEPKRNAPRPHRPGRGMMPTEKAKDFKGSFKKLISYLSPFKFKILIVVIFAALSTVFTIVGPKILAKATDELTAGLMRIITGAAEGIDFGYIAKVLLFLVGLYALSALFSYIQGFTMSGVSAKVSYNMRRAIMEKIDRLPVSYFHKTSQGDVLSRITNDVDTLSQSLNQSITQLITSVCSTGEKSYDVGNIYQYYAYSLAALLAGGSWSVGAYCGARAVDCINYPWYVDAYVGARGACDSL